MAEAEMKFQIAVTPLHHGWDALLHITVGSEEWSQKVSYSVIESWAAVLTQAKSELATRRHPDEKAPNPTQQKP